MGFARRVDANHAELKAAFERMGCSVLDLFRVGDGCPDLAVALHGHTEFVEVKSGDGKLLPEQRRFRREWKGVVHEARSVDDVVAIVTRMRQRNKGSRNDRP